MLKYFELRETKINRNKATTKKITKNYSKKVSVKKYIKNPLLKFAYLYL